jgi:hypothetical protein
MFEDTKEVIKAVNQRRRESTMVKRKGSNNKVQNTTQKTKTKA